MSRHDAIVDHRVESAESNETIRRIRNQTAASLIEKEWLVTNGLGGYASGTIAGATTRRYHGLLVAAHPAPLGRVLFVNHVGEQFIFPDSTTFTATVIEQASRTFESEGLKNLQEFRLENGLPIWRYAFAGHVIEKRIFMPHLQNTAHLTYHLIEGDGPVEVRLRPSVHFRGHNEPVSAPNPEPYILTASSGRYELADQTRAFPLLRLHIEGESFGFSLEEVSLADVLYRVEEGRGYENVGQMSSPGVFHATLTHSHDVSLTVSTESWERILAFSLPAALAAEIARRDRLLDSAMISQDDVFSRELVLAADEFIVSPATRVEEIARAEASGEQAGTIVAGYYWFTDWGRDAMISLEGLTLVTGRHAESRYILRTFIQNVRDGLIPNFFPDESTEGVYHTADATLWYFHALSRYIAYTDDRTALRSYLPILKDIVHHHQRGTRFGIRVDPEDGLLMQGAPGYQLTWMDAKVGDWVVTPRRGKAVEINALWYNALRLLENWVIEAGEDATSFREAADQARASFNKRFWCEDQQGLLDVVDGERGDDSSCRPNQIFALSLEHSILDAEKWKPVLHTVQERLLTPFGLRTLAPGHPDYKAHYFGDLRSRDAAYHQGTVWPWLLGPFVDAWRRVYPDRSDECRGFLTGFRSHLNEACIGTISEIFDAEAPYTPRGCAAQAWSVAELLRINSMLFTEVEDL